MQTETPNLLRLLNQHLPSLSWNLRLTGRTDPGRNNEAVDSTRPRPQKTWAPAQDIGMIAPAIGLPARKPSPATNLFMPRLVPVIDMSLVSETTEAAWSGIKAPEKKL